MLALLQDDERRLAKQVVIAEVAGQSRDPPAHEPPEHGGVGQADLARRLPQSSADTELSRRWITRSAGSGSHLSRSGAALTAGPFLESATAVGAL